MTLRSIHVVVPLFHAKEIKENEEEIRVPCHATIEVFSSQTLYVTMTSLFGNQCCHS